MRDNTYLKRIFQSYYKEQKTGIPTVSLFDHREFGFIPWDKPIMIRHMGFINHEDLVKYLMDNGPKHVYSSGSLYIQPDQPNMGLKKYQGCDLIIDIDVDHFYTPCKNDHDIWICKECGNIGKGMTKTCTKCKKTKLKNINWICEDCLEAAKKEITKLIFDFLIPDFGVKEEQVKIAFSGHRGYHVKVEEERIRKLTSEGRREIADYLSGDNISFEILGLKQVYNYIYSFTKENIGWSQKILQKVEDIIENCDYLELIEKLKNYGLSENRVMSFMNYKDDFLNIIVNKSNLWSLEGFGLKTWEIFLKGVIGEIGIEIDEPVTIDIHRLIRYPGTLHGKTGFKVQELDLKNLEDFNPLNENNEKIDPIVFYGKNLLKLKITEQSVPPTSVKNETFGPYKQDETIEVPNHIAVFLLCKEVAKMI
jgi:DNA primase small subunit